MSGSFCARCDIFLPLGKAHHCSKAPGLPGKQRTITLTPPEVRILEAEITQPDGSRWLFKRVA